MTSVYIGKQLPPGISPAEQDGQCSESDQQECIEAPASSRRKRQRRQTGTKASLVAEDYQASPRLQLAALSG
ncbi:hypothetical protein KDA_75660 [Dictyobacter alpinus]|uniref:Uncharacterized protein n=1 Tax=Dictyobacter alpinus TaxID=2014873 RepID=A0A402BL75_9CHLR|nr:hypothetical protein KDA_75660 [Dictyobacter alpinus]